MSNPFQEHAQNFADYQAMLTGDDGSGGAVMTVDNAPVPCTHSQIVTDFNLVPGGQSATTFIENLEFLASTLPTNYIPKKGKNFSLKANAQAAPLALKFFHGGLQQGGLIYRFMAVDVNYKG